MGTPADGDGATLSVTAAQVRAFRAAVHRLDRRAAGPDAITRVAGLCGLQDSPPGSAAVALHARVEGLTPRALDQALAVDRTLVRTWAMRGAPFVVPTADLAVFTTGVLPVDEDARTRLVVGVRAALDDLSGGLDDYVAVTADVVREVLHGQRLEIDELGRRVADRVAPTLSEHDRTVWRAEGPYARGQALGEAVVHFCIRILTLQQVLCFAPREGRRAPFVLLSEWLDDVPRQDDGDARRELATRHLRAHGPTTPAGLARWLGVAASDAAAWWDLVVDDVVRVAVDGSPRWLLAEDRDALEAARAGTIDGVRLLPPGDPLLQAPDREVLVPDRTHQRRLWRALHAPGALLVDGEVVGTWRGRRRSGHLEVAVEPFHPLIPAANAAVEEAAQALALARDGTEATVTVGEPSG